MSNVLVTGANGFIGSHLVGALHALGWDVTRIDADSEPFINKLQRVDLEEFDYVFHLLGSGYVPVSVSNPMKDFQLNLENTIQLLEALRVAASNAKVVFPSSGAVYGSPESLPIMENHRTEPVSPYGVSKLAAENYLKVYFRLYGVRAVILRLFSVYGPGQQKQVIFDLFRKMESGGDHMEVYGNGKQSRDFIHIEDVVKAMILAAESSIDDGSAFNIASGTSTSINELICMIAKILSARPNVVYTGQVRPGDVENWSVDITKARSHLNFRSNIPLENGLASVYSWLQETRPMNSPR